MALLLAGLLALQPAADGADWWYVEISVTPGDQDAYYSDRASIRRNGGRVVNCRARSGRVVWEAYLRPDGSSVDGGDPNEALRPVTPNSIGESLMRFACGEYPGVGPVLGQSLREHALRRFRADSALAPPPPRT